jgi:hypothetical protein
MFEQQESDQNDYAHAPHAYFQNRDMVDQMAHADSSHHNYRGIGSSQNIPHAYDGSV